MKTDFDDKIKSLYNSGEFVYKSENWDNLNKKLNIENRKASKREILFSLLYTKEKLMIAASIMLLLGLNYFWFNHESKHNSSSKTVATKQALPKVNIAAPIDTKAADPVIATEPFNNKDEKVLSPSVQKVAKHIITQSTNEKTKAKNSKEVLLPPFENKNITKEDIVQSNKENLPGISKEDNLIDKKSIQVKNDLAEKILNDKKYNPIDIGFSKPKDEKNNAGFSIQGSAGRGSNNSMYSAGVGYQIDLGNKFFIDGAIAVNTSSLEGVVRLENSPKILANAPASSFGANDVSETSYDYVRQNTNYANIGFNPSLGYALTKRLAIKAGVDLQQRIINSNELAFVESNELFKPLPNFDVGISPAIALKLNRHWQTNFIYRKGITSAISKKDYYDRNYFQLLLGYKF